MIWTSSLELQAVGSLEPQKLVLYCTWSAVSSPLTSKGTSLQLGCLCQGPSLGKGCFHAWEGRAWMAWHHPAAQPRQPLQRAALLGIPAPSKLTKRNIGFDLEGWGLYKFCLTTNSTQDGQFLKTKLSLCGCTILKTRLEVLPDVPPLTPQSTTLLTVLYGAAHKFWSDLASQNLTNM